MSWPELGLAPSADGIDWTSVRAARPAPKPEPQPRIVVPGGVEYESDIQREYISITVEHTPNHVLRYRREARSWDPSRLYELYDELPRMGPGPQLDRARKAIMAAKLEFAPMPESARDENDKSAEAELGRRVASYLAGQLNKPKRRTEMLRALERRRNYGVGALAFKVEPGAGPDGLEKVTQLEEIPPRRFRLDPTKAEWRFYPQRWNQGTPVPIEPLMQIGSLIFLEDGSRTTPLDQRGVLSQVVFAACIFLRGLRWWARLCEQHGIPPRLATYKKNIQNGEELAEKLAVTFGASGYGIKPEGIELEFVNAISSVQPDMHEKLEEFCLRCFDSAILGHSQAMTVRSSGGGRTWAEAADVAFRSVIAHDLEIGAADLQEQIVESMVLRNFGPAVAEKHTPVLTLTFPEPVNRLEEAQIAATSVLAGAEIPQTEYLKRIGYREARPGERVLKRAASAQPGITPQEKPGGKLSFLGGLGEEGAPDGIGEEIVAPYREIFRKSLAEGVTPAKALQRVVQRASQEPDAPELIDRLTSVLFDNTLQGIVDVRREREAK